MRECTRIGHLRGIVTKIRALETTIGTGHLVVTLLHDCVDWFDLAGLLRTLEKA